MRFGPPPNATARGQSWFKKDRKKKENHSKFLLWALWICHEMYYFSSSSTLPSCCCCDDDKSLALSASFFNCKLWAMNVWEIMLWASKRLKLASNEKSGLSRWSKTAVAPSRSSYIRFTASITSSRLLQFRHTTSPPSSVWYMHACMQKVSRWIEALRWRTPVSRARKEEIKQIK